jgi:hypothetical protein
MRSLAKILLVAILLTGTAYTFAEPHPTVKSNDPNIVDRHLSGFNGVHVGGSFDVYITQGTTESVKVEAPEDVIDNVVTGVDGGVLKIYNKNEHWGWFNWGWNNHKKVVVYVTAKDLNSIVVSGSGDVLFKDGITTNSLSLRVSGSGDMQGKVDAKTLESKISGSGNMKLTGRTESSSVRVSGSGNFSAGDLLTVSSSVHISGSGNARINASDKVDASVSGSGDVRYTGTAKSIFMSKSGSGQISKY